MNVQNRQDNSSVPFIRYSGPAAIENDGVLAQDGARSVDLVFGTLLAYNPTTEKYVPYTDETAVDGSAIPSGIYIGGDIAFADIVAGDMVDLPILVGNAFYDVNQLTIENSKTLDTIITVGTTDLRSVRQHLRTLGLFDENTVDTSSFEN